jgi:hypothetical protein
VGSGRKSTRNKCFTFDGIFLLLKVARILVILSGPGTEAFVIESSLQVFPRHLSFRQQATCLDNAYDDDKLLYILHDSVVQFWYNIYGINTLSL